MKPRARVAFLFFWRLLAAGTNAKELQPMRHPLETVGLSDSLLQFRRETFLDFHHRRALQADQVVMMSVVPLLEQLKARPTISEVESLDHAHLLQQVHRAINRGQVTILLAQFGEHFLDAQRMRMTPE